MKEVAQYNTAKGISTTLTFGTPIITLLCCGDFFVHRSETAMSAAGVFALLLSILFLKDKILEYFKSPSALVVSGLALILILLVEHIIEPIKTVCIVTIIACGVDELTFKLWYKQIEKQLPEKIANKYKHIGFIFARTEKIMKEAKDAKGE